MDGTAQVRRATSHYSARCMSRKVDREWSSWGTNWYATVVGSNLISYATKLAPDIRGFYIQFLLEKIILLLFCS